MEGEQFMDMAINCLLFAIGVILVVKGGDVFVDSASSMARILNIPSFIIGATIVSLATTMPEMIVSIIAAVEGKTEMAIGNAVGSVTANTGLIMAVAMIAMSILCNRKKYFRQCVMLIASAAVLLVSCLKGSLNTIGAIVLAVIFVLFMFENVRQARNNMNEAENSEPIDKKLFFKNICFFVLAAIAIVVGSRLMVTSGSAIATALGVPERIIAITLVAIGTSLPELVTTITAIIKKESALSIGNIIGANIIDLSLILPMCSLVSGKPLPVSVQSATVDIPVCLGFTLFATIPLLIRQKSSRIQGLIMLVGYVVYILLVI